MVTNQAILGANVRRDVFAGLADIVGRCSAGLRRIIEAVQGTAIEEMVAEAEQMGADAVIGVDVDYELIQLGAGREHADGQHLGHRRQAVALGELSNLST